MKKHFGFRKLIPCYTEEGRCEECCGDLGVCSLPLLSVYPNAWELARVVLEPARERYGKPMRVLRCFQCHAMVKKLGLDERYATGEVADVAPVQGSRFTVQDLAKAIVANGKWDQMILYPTFVHVSYKRNGGNRRQILRKTATGYEKVEVKELR